MIERINTNEVKREIGKYGYGGYPIDEAINLFAKKINELIDAFNEHTKPVEMSPRLDNLPISATGCQHESDGMVYTSNPPQYKCKKCGQFYR